MKAKLFCLSMTVVILAQSPVTAQWYQQTFPGSEYLWKVSFVSETTGWILARDGVYGTTDGGISWVMQDTLDGRGGYTLRAIDEKTVVFSNYIPPPYTWGIRRTSDGGLTWSTVDSLSVYYVDFQFVTPQVGYAAGTTSPDDHSILRKTTDGGTSWFTVSTIPGTNYDFTNGISFLTEAEGWVITYAGTIYHTVDGGLNWIVQDSSGIIQSMRDIQFATRDKGWAVGGISGNMRRWRTTDGGESWIKEETSGCSLVEIAMVDSNVGWFAGTINSPPYVTKTTDGGETWVEQDLIPFSDGFESISMVNENTGWGVTCCGRVYKTTNGGTTFVDGEPGLPGAFSLEQNYPNPFNAETVFRFQIAPARPNDSQAGDGRSGGDYGSVSLRIFNLLGQEVVTVVDEMLSPGTYTRRWDAAGLPSGVYCYRLQAGGYVETRKLVLLR